MKNRFITALRLVAPIKLNINFLKKKIMRRRSQIIFQLPKLNESKSKHFTVSSLQSNARKWSILEGEPTSEAWLASSRRKESPQTTGRTGHV